MTDLTGKKPSNTYPWLLQCTSGISATFNTVRDGENNASPLQLRNNAVKINGGTFVISNTTTVTGLTVADVVGTAGTLGDILYSTGSGWTRLPIGASGTSLMSSGGTLVWK